jgi:hypothetical protein
LKPPLTLNPLLITCTLGLVSRLLHHRSCHRDYHHSHLRCCFLSLLFKGTTPEVNVHPR